MKRLKSIPAFLLALTAAFAAAVLPVSAMADESAAEPLEQPPEIVWTEEPSAPEPGEPFSEGSGLYTRDTLFDKASNKQFLTVSDRDGNLFYIIIDYDAPVGEEEEQYQTYFLNAVDAADLAALGEEEQEPPPPVCSCLERCQLGEVKLNCDVCAADLTACAGEEPEPEPELVQTEPDPEPEKPSAGPWLLLLLLAAIGGGGGFLYWKFWKNRPDVKGDTQLDEYDYGEEEEEETEYLEIQESEDNAEEEGENLP